MILPVKDMNLMIAKQRSIKTILHFLKPYHVSRPMGRLGRAVTVAHSYYSTAAQLRFSPILETERELNQLK